MYELPKRVQSHILPGEAFFLSSSSALGAGSLCFLSSTIIQMVYGVHITWVCRLVLWYKDGKSFETMLSWNVHRLFLLRAFQLFLVTYPHTEQFLETLIENIMWSWTFFTFLFCGIITHILTAFSIIFLTQLVKKRPSTPWFVF